MEARQVAAWPLDEQDDVTDEEFRRVLVARARHRQARFNELHAQYRRVAEEIERERQYIEDLNLLLRDEGMALIPVPSAPNGAAVEGVKPLRTEGGDFASGNRSPRMPERYPEYTEMSLTDAVTRLLAGGQTMHADDLVRTIYDVQNHTQHRAAKATLGSTLATGAKRGYWARGDEPATYRAKPEEGAQRKE